MAFRTLEEMRVILRDRLGFASAGASAGANEAILNSFLSNGQVQIYWAQDWIKLKQYNEQTLGVGQYLAAYPIAGEILPNGATLATDAYPERILTVAINRSTIANSPDWKDLEDGIDTHHYNTQQILSYPQRCALYENNIELWPKNDSIRPLRIWFIRKLGRFTLNGDRATLDDEMIMLHALANAKAHYRHPDAQAYATQLGNLMSKIRGESFGNRRYLFRGAETKDDVPPRPVVV